MDSVDILGPKTEKSRCATFKSWILPFSHLKHTMNSYKELDSLRLELLSKTAITLTVRTIIFFAAWASSNERWQVS